MSDYLRNLPAWPASTPLPAAGLLLYYDFGTDKEYRIVPGQVGSGSLPAYRITLAEAQAAAAAFTLYAIASYAGPAEDGGNISTPTWNNEPVQRIVLVQGLPGGSWASEGLLVLAGGGTKRVLVDVAAGTYAPVAAGTGERLTAPFNAGGDNTQQLTLETTITYTAKATTNVASATLDGANLTLPVTLVGGQTYALTITRTTPANGAVLTLSA